MRISQLVATVICAALTLPGTGFGKTIIVRDGESIQDAVDAASPGDTIIVKPGIYTAPAGETEYVVEVEKDDITIKGSKAAIIDATGVEYGIMVGEDEPIGSGGCPPITVHGFELNGLTIRNAADTGVRLSGVDDFRLTHSAYIDNEEYGPFPVCSSNGVISHNFVSGHNDAGIYVGDDINIDVTHNVATDNVVAAEIENSLDCTVTHNRFFGNSGGLLVFVGANLPMPFTEGVLVSHNKIHDNNRTNTGSGAIAGVPEGTGILIFGSDDVTVEHNHIRNNDSFGLAVLGNFNVFLDPRIEPFNDNLIVKKNKIKGNGANPDTLRSFVPGADIVFLPDVFDPGPITGTPGTLLIVDPDPSDNCFEKNKFDVDFPPGIVAAFPCPES